MTVIINESDNCRSLLSYLQNSLRLSHKQISALKRLERGMILNGVHVTVRAILHTGDALELDLDDSVSSENIKPNKLDFDVIFEDHDLIAVNKPANMPTHTSHNHIDDTLANALAYYYQSRGQSFIFRPINRLDRDTSGIVLIAKNKHAAYILSDQMQKKQIHKSYVAVLSGKIDPPQGSINAWISRESDSIITRRATEYEVDGAQNAFTEYTTVSSNDAASLVYALPKTGRTHQLRVHFSYIGHPIIGDSLYFKESPLISRQALHAHTLTFNLPSTGKQVTLQADIPSDIVNLCKELKL